MKINSEQEMLDFAKDFAWINDTHKETLEAFNKIKDNAKQDPSRAIVIELVGDVGAGKTTFVRGLAQGLGIKEPITSPSFTISKSYALKNGGFLVHYDFYRLQDPGLMSEDLQALLDDSEETQLISKRAPS